MEISAERARLLLEIGLMAAWRGDTVDARTIFTGLQSALPDSPMIDVGLAVALLNEGHRKSAIKVLERALQKDDQCDLAKSHLALACKVAGFESRCNSLCADVIAADRDESAVALAETFLAIPAATTTPNHAVH